MLVILRHSTIRHNRLGERAMMQRMFLLVVFILAEYANLAKQSNENKQHCSLILNY